MRPDINRLLKVYLGADENGGYEPLYGDERMREAFPDSYPQALEVIAPYLEENQEPDRTRGSLIQQAESFEATLRQKFPELDGSVLRALANRWHFGWSR